MQPSKNVIDQVKDYPLRHLRVLGPPASGKTRLLVDRYKSLLERGHAGEVFVLTYSSEHRSQVSGALMTDGSASAGPSPVMTYFGLAREIITATGRKPPRILEGLEEVLLIRKVIADCEHDFRSEYKSIRDSESLHRELLDLFHFLLQNGIKGDQLERLQAEAQTARLADIFMLYRKFRTLLETKGRVTYYDIARLAENACHALPRSHPLSKARVFLLDDFQDIDAGQFALLTSLAPPDGETAVNVFGDPMGAYFGFRGTHPRYLLHDFPNIYPCETLNMSMPRDEGPLGETLHELASEVLGVAGCHVSEPSPSDRRGDKKPKTQTRTTSSRRETWGPLFDSAPPVRHASPAQLPDEKTQLPAVELEVVDDEVREVYTAAAKVHEIIADGRYRPDDIAVITNVKHRYEPMLRAAFAQWGVPLDTGRPLQGVFRDFVYALLELLAYSRNPVAVQSLTTSPFYPHFRREYLQSVAPGTHTLQEIAELRRYLQSVASELGELEYEKWMTHIIEHCVRKASEPYRQETEDESFAGFQSVLSRRWAEYVTALRSTGQKPDLRVFVRVGGLFATRSAMPMPSAEEVGFYSCREARDRFFPVVLVIGCSELLFPSAMQGTSIMPTASLQALFDDALPDLRVQIYGARKPLEHLYEQYHLLYHTLSRAQDALYLSAPKTFAGQTYPAPATILDESLPESIRVKTPPERRTPPQIRFANAWIHQPSAPDLRERLKSVSTLGWMWNLSPPVKESFAIARFALSQSSLETFLRCPRRFFLHKVLRIEEEDTEAQKVGRLFHDAMAAFGRQFSSKQALHEGVDDTFVRKTVDRLSKESGVTSASFLGRSLSFHLRAMVRGVLDLDRRESDDYVIKGVEKDFKFEYRGWEFRGRMDRIQATNAGATVLDYKTGEVNKTGANLREKTLDTLTKPDQANWQVPIYVWAHCHEEKELPDTFRLLVQKAGDRPFFVTLYVRKNDADIPGEALSKKREYNRFSYLLESEVKRIMDYAADHAEQIFSERSSFDKTDDIGRCRHCLFKGLCGRRVE
ncbi:MAG: PD-(D/E)XK nuclease family protein [Candidatus Krumholzibacteria bacterium]|nr:PD-(D/E)XK nuclease family protein [Candidatus Krumholzibacteria bacterium]